MLVKNLMKKAIAEQPQGLENDPGRTIANVRRQTARLALAKAEGATEDELPSLENIPNHPPGRRVAALAGITEDASAKELPGLVMDIIIPTRNPRSAYADLKEFFDIFNGKIIAPIWTETGKIGVKALFGNSENATRAASAIKSRRPKARCALSDQTVQAFTLDGDLLTIGQGDILNTAANEDIGDGKMRIYTGTATETFDPARVSALDGEITGEISERALTKESEIHAVEDIRQPNVEIPDTGVLLQIHLPKYLANAQGAAIISKYIGLLQTKYLTLKSMQGNVATLYIAGERSPGNVLKKLAPIQSETDKMNITLVFDYGRYHIVELDDQTFTLQGRQQRNLHKSPPNPGKWITERFKRASAHERNLSAANCRHLGMDEDSGLEKIDTIESTEFRPVILGRATVGRETEFAAAKSTIEDTLKTNTTHFLTVTGRAGVGKTDFIKRIFDKFEEPEFRAEHGDIRATYYKIMEDGALNHGLAIRKLIEGILQKADAETQRDFLDLKFFSDGEVPGEFKAQHESNFNTLSNNHEYLAERVAALMAKGADIVTTDDCQWLDEFSLKTLCEVVKLLPAQSKTLLIFLGRNEEEPLPESLEEAIGKKGDHSKKIDIPQLQEKDIEGCIRAHLPGNMAKAKTIPETFVAKVAAISHGVPLIITEMLSLLCEQGKIYLEGDILGVPADERLETFDKSNPSETLSTIIQAKFARLSDDELVIVDYIAVIGEIEMGLFKAALKALGIDKTQAQGLIDSLEAKKIIRKQPKLAFLYDQMGTERKNQTDRRVDLSKRACQCYEIFKKQRGKYPEYITPAFLFRMLALAAQNPEQLTPGEMQTVSREYLPLGNEAIDHCMGRSQNLAAIDIADTMQPAITKLEAKIAGGTADDEHAPARAKYLYGTNLRIARANLRVARAGEARKALERIQKIQTERPQTHVLKSADGTTPIEALPYYVMQVKTAFAARDPAHLPAANLELATVVTELEMTAGANTPELILAKGELLIGQIQASSVFGDFEGFQKLESDSKTAALRKDLLALMRHGSSPEMKESAHAILVDIIRQTTQSRGVLKTIKSVEGKTGEESLFMQEVDETQARELHALQEEINELIQIYEAKHDLIRDPETYGNLVDTAARIDFLLANAKDGKKHSESAEALFRKTLRIAQNWKLPQLTARARLLKGNVLTGRVLLKGKLAPERWDSKALTEAVTNYGQGYGEMMRIAGEEDFHAVANALNGALSTAMLAISTKDSKLRDEVKAAYNRANKTLRFVKRAYYDANPSTGKVPDQAYREIFLNEMATIGLLRKAGEILGVNLQLPDYIDAEIISTSTTLIQSPRPDEALYTEGDKLFIGLRRMGIKGLQDNVYDDPRAPAWAEAKTDPAIG